MPNNNNYFEELKRRKVFTSAGLYAFSSFIIMQVASFIVPALQLPPWTNTLILTLLVLGFPIAMIFAWIYDRTSDGLIKTDSDENKLNSLTEADFPKDSTGKTAIVLIDIADYTKLMNHDEKKAIDLLHYKNKIIIPFINEYKGILIKRVGGGTLCVFPDSAKAVCFSLEILQIWKEISPTKLKVGIHLDNVVFEQGDILGKGVNYTFKINALAKSGGICLSKVISDEIKDRPDIRITSMGDNIIDGFTETHELFYVNIPEKFVPMENDINVSLNSGISEKVNYSSMVGWAGGILIIIFLLLQGTQYFNKSKVNELGNSIAVFPFDNILKNDDYEWLSEGFARTLTFKLSEVKKLNVIDQLQILKTIEKVQPQEAGIAYDILARKTAEKMNINLMLQGSYQIYGEQIQIIAKLVDVETGLVQPLIMELYPLSDLLSRQTDIAEKISILLTKKNNSDN